MTFTTTCRHCKKVIEFLDVQAGTKSHCPRCNRPLILRVSTSAWLKWLLIPLSIIALTVAVCCLLYLLVPGFEESLKESFGFVKRFFGPASGPPKK